jgi:maltose phosphorylase
LEPLDVKAGNEAFVTAQTFKTHFKVTTFMQNTILENGRKLQSRQQILTQPLTESNLVMMCWWLKAKNHLFKLGGYTVSLNHNNTVSAAEK